jgi:hypothetical protein
MTTKPNLEQRITITLYGEEVVRFHKLRQYEENGMTLLRDITETVKSKLFAN